MINKEQEFRHRGEEFGPIVVKDGLLGDFSSSPRDPLSLLKEATTVVNIPHLQPGSIITFAFPHRPFAGEHLVQFVNTMTPFHDYPGKGGIVADLHMPVVAKRRIAQGREPDPKNSLDNINLHLNHMSDPRIKEKYDEFVTYHLRRVLEAFSYNTSDPVFFEAQRVVFIRSRKAFLDGFYSGVNSAFERADLDNVDRISRIAYERYRNGQSFKAFFMDKSDYKPGGDTAYIPHQFQDLPPERRIELLREFINGLSQENREVFAFDIFHRYLTCTVDLETRKIKQGDWTTIFAYQNVNPPSIELADSKTVLIRNEAGAQVLITPDQDGDFGTVEGKYTGYQFTPDYYSQAMYAVLAFETMTSGEQRFLPKKEAEPLIRKVWGHSRWGDVKLGEILAAYLLPNVTKQWEKKMQLAAGHINQQMMGAQMFVWPSLDDHAGQLFADGAPLFSKLAA